MRSSKRSVRFWTVFAKNHTDLLPAVELLKTCYEQLPAGPQTDFFKALAGRLQSEPIRFPSSANSNRSSHILIIRAWAAFGPADALPNLLFSLLTPDTRETLESWAFMIGTELVISLGSYSDRFSEAALARIKAQCALITCDQSIGLNDSRFPAALVEVSQRLENLVKKIEFDRNVVQKLRPQLKRFDQSLFELKLREPSRKMHEEIESRRRKVQIERRKIGQGEGVGLFLALVDSDLDVLREFLEKDIDRICREVWRTQGNAVNADFVRVVLLGTVLNIIEVRTGAIKWGIEEMAKRQRSSEDLFPVRTHLVQAIDQLKFIISNRYEIEARELQHRNGRANNVITTHGFDNAPNPVTGSSASEWQEFHNRFMQLANEEEQIERGAPRDRLLRAHCDYSEHPEILHEKGKPEQGRFCLLKSPETGLWIVSDGVNENFQERFRALAAHAGVTLGSPKGTDPEDFWLHGLFLDLCENDSDLLLCESSQRTNIIKRVCVASATFCSRLERKAITRADRASTEGLYGQVLTGVGASKSKIGMSLERSLFAPRDSRISRAANKRDNRGSRPRGNKPSEGFSHSPDYRSVTIRGKAHTLTARQAQIIEILHKAHVDGNPDVSTAHILETLETKGSRWQDTFRTNPKAKSALIKGGARRGTLRLNL